VRNANENDEEWLDLGSRKTTLERRWAEMKQERMRRCGEEDWRDFRTLTTDEEQRARTRKELYSIYIRELARKEGTAQQGTKKWRTRANTMKREGRRIENTWRITCISRSWILRNLQSDGINNDKWIDYFEFSLHSHWCEECHPLELAVSITNVLMCPPESLHSWTEQIANGLLACLLDSHTTSESP